MDQFTSSTRDNLAAGAAGPSAAIPNVPHARTHCKQAGGVVLHPHLPATQCPCIMHPVSLFFVSCCCRPDATCVGLSVHECVAEQSVQRFVFSLQHEPLGCLGTV
jgi:hypothetical protein